MCGALRGDVPGSERARSFSTGRTPSACERTTIIPGRRRGKSVSRRPTTLEAALGRESSTSRRWRRTPRPTSSNGPACEDGPALSPRGAQRPDPHELEGRRARRACRSCRRRRSSCTERVTATRTSKRVATSQSGFPARSSSSFRGTTTSRASNPDQILDEVEEFLTGAKPAPVSERVLATVLFTDLVGSTEQGARARRPRVGRAARAAPRGRSGASSRASAARRSTRPATASSRSARARRARSAARSRFGDAVSAARPERPRRRAHRRGGTSARRRLRAGSPCTSARVSPRRQARTRCSSARRRATSSPAPASSSRTAASSS